MTNGNDHVHIPHPVEQTKEQWTWLTIARTLTDDGRFEEALATCEQAICLAPNDIDAWCEKGFILSHSWFGRKEEPRVAYEYALADYRSESVQELSV